MNRSNLIDYEHLRNLIMEKNIHKNDFSGSNSLLKKFDFYFFKIILRKFRKNENTLGDENQAINLCTI